MTYVYIDTEFITVHTAGEYPFLIVEPKGNLQLDQYKAELSNPDILAIIERNRLPYIYLELNGLWTIGMDQQEWTVGPFQVKLKEKGVTKMAIGLAEHVYPTFSLMAGSYEKKALIETRYFPDLDQMVAFLS